MLGKLGLRILLVQALSISSAIASPFMLWKGVSIFANTNSPVVVVLSGSMKPAFSRGDILFLTSNPSGQPYRIGDITVYKVPGQDIPIVHRVMETRDTRWGSDGLSNVILDVKDNQMLLTKGDNNPVDDLELYGGLEYLERKHIVGKVWGFVPYVGYMSIFLNDFKIFLSQRSFLKARHP